MTITDMIEYPHFGALFSGIKNNAITGLSKIAHRDFTPNMLIRGAIHGFFADMMKNSVYEIIEEKFNNIHRQLNSEELSVEAQLKFPNTYMLEDFSAYATASEKVIAATCMTLGNAIRLPVKAIDYAFGSNPEDSYIDNTKHLVKQVADYCEYVPGISMHQDAQYIDTMVNAMYHDAFNDYILRIITISKSIEMGIKYIGVKLMLHECRVSYKA